MGHTRYYSYSCDVSGCHNVIVHEWWEYSAIPATPPEGWLILQSDEMHKQYVCKDCQTNEKFGALMKELFPPRYVQSQDLAAGSLDMSHLLDPTSVLEITTTDHTTPNTPPTPEKLQDVIKKFKR